MAGSGKQSMETSACGQVYYSTMHRPTLPFLHMRQILQQARIAATYVGMVMKMFLLLVCVIFYVSIKSLDARRLPLKIYSTTRLTFL